MDGLKPHDVVVLTEDFGGLRSACGLRIDGTVFMCPIDAPVTTAISPGGPLTVTLTIFASDVTYERER